ncbi:MAG: aminotransferase class III-fold pyridoxal phosphate-dependent enzyme [Actinomycetota bacterium]|nr:aminotransferase class III-fold pyridoxal phosphate-dependent enzyme [Actinomycetota bacterium]
MSLTVLNRSRALFDRARTVLPGGNTRTTLFIPPHPPYAARGEGYELIDMEGHRLIDLHANYTALVHGHAHPSLVEAATEAVRDGSAFGLPTEAEIQLAETLSDRVRAVEQIRFTNSGTEAVMMAIRAARVFTGRSGILRFEAAYHGTYDAVLPSSSPGIADNVRADSAGLPFGEEDAFRAAIAEREEDVACVLLDLMPNRVGLAAASQAFAELVRAETRRRNILLIVDEVITFRLGFGGLHELYGLEPDLVTFGKIIGGGFPAGAFGGRRDVMDVFDPAHADHVPHGGTFSANPVTMRTGLAALELLDEAAITRINGLGERLQEGLAAAGFEVAGRGSLLRIDGGERQRELWWRLYEEGVLVTPNGLVAVSTPMDEAVIDDVVERAAATRS